MKAGTCALAVSMLAASTAALTATSTAPNEGNSPYVKAKICVASSSEKGKFAPRFDGLRFIKTLVTAHR